MSDLSKVHAVIVNGVSIKPEDYEALRRQAVERDVRVGEIVSELIHKVLSARPASR